jgi:transcriptional regulator with XRE-family HTH domain
MYERYESIIKELGITTYRLCKETGIPPSTFSDWKKGKSSPKIDKMQKIADYLGVHVDYLLGKTEFKTQDKMFKSFDEKYPNAAKEVREYEIETIAAHHDGEDWTEEELEEIEKFKEFVKMKRSR